MNNDTTFKSFIVDENGEFHSKTPAESAIKFTQESTSSGSKCSTCEKKSEPCVSFFAHENSMMHKDIDNERAHRTTLFVCITFMLIVVIFVTAYTIRTNIWLDTIKEMNAAIVQLANAKGIISP